MNKQEYEGWTNYETWAVALWWDNDEGTYDLRVAAGNELRPQGPAVFAEWIKDQTEEMCPARAESSLQADLLGAALSEVNWYEIAENWLAE